MPLSTWTTRSPTFRSRKSERNVRVADRRRSWTCRSSSKTSVSAQSCSAASGQAEAARQVADADEHRRGVRVLGALDRHREDLVVGEQLDRALGAALRVRDEHDRVAALAAAPDLGDPVRHAAGELQRRLTRRCASPGSSSPSASVSSAVAAVEPGGDRRPSRRRASSGGGARWPCAQRFVVAGVHLLAQPCGRAP